MSSAIRGSLLNRAAIGEWCVVNRNVTVMSRHCSDSSKSAQTFTWVLVPGSSEPDAQILLRETKFEGQDESLTERELWRLGIDGDLSTRQAAGTISLTI